MVNGESKGRCRHLIPAAVPVNVAQVPVVYQVPALIIHPVRFPPVTTFKYPLPTKAPPVEVGAGAEYVADRFDDCVGAALAVPVGPTDGVGLEEKTLGRYRMPVWGQLRVSPTNRKGC